MWQPICVLYIYILACVFIHWSCWRWWYTTYQDVSDGYGPWTPCQYLPDHHCPICKVQVKVSNHELPYPICSMYGIFTYIYPTNGPNVGKYTIHGASGYGPMVIKRGNGKSLLCVESSINGGFFSTPWHAMFDDRRLIQFSSAKWREHEVLGSGTFRDLQCFAAGTW